MNLLLDILNRNTKEIEKKKQGKTNNLNQITVNSAEITDFKSDIIEIDKEIADIDTELKRLRTTAGGSTSTRMSVITAESRKKKDKTEEEADLVTDKIRLLDEINDFQTVVNPVIDKEITTLKTDINTIQLTDIPTMTGVLSGHQTIIEQPKENLELNKVETLKSNNVNRPIIKRYEDVFNTLDRNHYIVTQETNIFP
jgi:hypothetical protein